jgi:Na+/proline symporter
MVLVYIAMTVLLLVLGFTQVYAKVHALGWTGFGTLLLIALFISLSYKWFNLKVYPLQTTKEPGPGGHSVRLSRSEHGL